MYYKVTAFPGSPTDHIEFKNDRYRIFTKEPAQDNRANYAILKILADHLNITLKSLHIIKGHHGMSKIIEKIPER